MDSNNSTLYHLNCGICGRGFWSYDAFESVCEDCSFNTDIFKSNTTVIELTSEEVKQYMDMPVGVKLTGDMIRIVSENEEEKQILEITASGMSKIRIDKQSRPASGLRR